MKLVAAILLLMPGLSCPAFAQVTDPVSSVAGTFWAGIVNTPDASGKFQDYAYEFEFLDGNKLRWRWRGTIYVNGRWQQKGREILLEMIDNHSTWRGTIEGDRVVGSSLNNHGYKWNWVLLRQTRPLPASTQVIPIPDKWFNYSSRQGDFIAQMPVEPRVTEQALTIDDVQVVNNVALALTQFAVFAVSYADLPPNISGSKNLLDKVRKGVIAGISGKLKSNSNISHKGYAGREFQAIAESGLYTSRIFLVNNRLYQLVVVGVPGKVSADEVTHFLSSFDFKVKL
jgi:hypothetical protein